MVFFLTYATEMIGLIPKSIRPPYRVGSWNRTSFRLSQFSGVVVNWKRLTHYPFQGFCRQLTEFPFVPCWRG